MSVLAIDAGTTRVAATVVDPRGRVVATAARELPRRSPHPGWVEHVPEELWQATLGAAREVLGAVDASDLSAIGVATQRGTVLLWDRETLGSPRPAIAGQDRRTVETCALLRSGGHADRVAELTGLPLEPGCSGSALRWLADHEPHTWALVESGRYAVGTVDSYLVARMTRGTWHVTDVANAARTSLLDLGSGRWSAELCAVFGVPPDALPDLVPSWGEVASSDRRAFLGLELPIAGLAGDRQAALFGQACFEVGDIACTVGAEPSVLAHTGATPGRPGSGLVPTTAWRSPDGELAYALEGTGAGPDGVTGAVREVLRRLPQVATVRVGGAGAADDRECQRQADLLGLPVERAATLDATGLGAAFLAGLGTGVWRSTDELREVWAPGRRFLPARTTD